MKTRTLQRGNVEAYNEHLRIRLEIFPGQAVAIVTIFQLKPNGYCHAKRKIEVQQPITIEELILVYNAFEAAA